MVQTPNYVYISLLASTTPFNFFLYLSYPFYTSMMILQLATYILGWILSLTTLVMNFTSYYNFCISIILIASQWHFNREGIICLFQCFNFLILFPGLGQVQIKLGDFRSALSNFEKVLEVYPDNCETLKVSAKIERIISFTFFCIISFSVCCNLRCLIEKYHFIECIFVWRKCFRFHKMLDRSLQISWLSICLFQKARYNIIPLICLGKSQISILWSIIVGVGLDGF
jgi:hypothetical protein